MTNAQVVQSLFQAYESGDEETLAGLFADDVVFHMPGRGSISGTFRGKAEVLGWMGRMGAAAGESFKIDLHAVLADADHGVALVTEGGERNGKLYEWREVDVFHVKDGRITEAWVLIDDLYAADEYLS